MTCQSLFGVGDGFAAGVAEGLADDFGVDFDDDDFDLDFARAKGPRERQRTPATRREVSRGAFIGYRGAGWVPLGYRIRHWRWTALRAFNFRLPTPRCLARDWNVARRSKYSCS